MARVLAGVAIGIVAVFALPVAPASAHAELISSNSKDGATIKTLPSQIELKFSEEIGTPAFVEVTASDGTQVGPVTRNCSAPRPRCR